MIPRELWVGTANMDGDEQDSTTGKRRGDFDLYPWSRILELSETRIRR